MTISVQDCDQSVDFHTIYSSIHQDCACFITRQTELNYVEMFMLRVKGSLICTSESEMYGKHNTRNIVFNVHYQ